MSPDTKIVAIINLTPDSFSDGGLYDNTDRAIAAIRQCMADGADVIDIGAESTRPGAMPVTSEEEWHRLYPVLNRLADIDRASVMISLDTRHAKTVEKALDFGIDWINDVSGFASENMVKMAAASCTRLVVMHSLSVPADQSIVLSASVDPVTEVMAFAKRRLHELEQSGVARDRLIFDPGIGFGKTAEQSLELLRRIEEFFVLGVPLLVGHSRKSFLAKPGDTVAMRDEATLAVSYDLAMREVHYLRVHNVALHRRALDDMRKKKRTHA